MKINICNNQIFITSLSILFLFIIFILFLKYYQQKNIESFGDFHEFINIPQNMCYYDNVKNEIDKNYDMGDLKENVINCIEYINPGMCIPNDLTEQLQYLKNNIVPAYYDENTNPAFSCDCSKLMNIKYSGIDPKNQKLIGEIQKSESS